MSVCVLVYVYVCVDLCVCLCVCVCVGGGLFEIVNRVYKLHVHPSRGAWGPAPSSKEIHENIVS